MDDRTRKNRELWSFLRGAITTLAVIVLLYFLSMWLPIGGSASKPGTLQALRKTKEIERIISSNYLDTVDEQSQTDYMYVGQVAGLGDKYSTYYTEEEYKTLKKSTTGSYKGIGISIAKTDDGSDQLIVTECLEGYPAFDAGVQVNDVIVAINGESTESMSSSDAASKIQNSENDLVSLTLSRESVDESFTIELELTEMELTSVTGKMLDKSTGYIQITQFTGVTAEQYKKTYGELKIQGMKRLIIDLRDNPGGLVDGVCDTLRQILPKGLIVYTVDKNGTKDEKTCDGNNVISIPLVVLVNENSASASEIFAGAVQDYGIGTIVGKTTFGKGIVQNTFRLSDGSYLKLTVSKYYTPNGNDINGKGITPDVEVEEDETTEQDEQLDKALDLVSNIE